MYSLAHVIQPFDSKLYCTILILYYICILFGLQKYPPEFKQVQHGPPQNFDLLHQMFAEDDGSLVQLDDEYNGNNASQGGDFSHGSMGTPASASHDVRQADLVTEEMIASQGGDLEHGSMGIPSSASPRNNQADQVAEEIINDIEEVKKKMIFWRDINRKNQHQH